MDIKPAKREYLDKTSHTVRASQAVLQYGVGAMVDFPTQTLMTAAPEYWEKNVVKIHDERLEKVLNVNYFGVPGDKDTYSEGISYARFPEWYFCPKCRDFMPISEWKKKYTERGAKKAVEEDPHMVKHMQCPICRIDLAVARIITVCECGHIDDFPWIEWVHCRNTSGPKHICAHPHLKFKVGATTAEGLESLTVTCESCRSRATLKGAMAKDVFSELDEQTDGKYNFKCKGNHPWKHKLERCVEYPRAMQRGGSSVYFPFIESSLVIPPYSNRITVAIEKSAAYDECRISVKDALKNFSSMGNGVSDDLKNVFINNTICQYSQKIALETEISEETVKEVLERRWIAKSVEHYNTAAVKYRAEEYKALNGDATADKDEKGDFLREATDSEAYSLPCVKSVSLIHKLREVQALVGFTRCNPVEKTSTTENTETLVPVKEADTDWYPAYEVRGEGIFIEFDADEIKKWCKNNPNLDSRADIINRNYKESFIGKNNPRTVTAKFLFLHTLSHLLIKQLSFECGYNIASLKERIYCSEISDGYEMQGILIYTASGDAEGTLGGLVRQGRADAFPSIFKKAVESAMVCSNDPVCSLSLGQGRDSLNLAACYSCTLIPETSCEEFNIFLDRGTVVGTFENKGLGMYSKQLYENASWISDNTNVNPEKISSHEKSSSFTETIAVVDGIDLSDEEYSEIWNNIKDNADDSVERKLILQLLANVNSFLGKEKPFEGCVLNIENYKYEADLVWKKSKIIYFSSEHDDEYQAVKDKGWTCFYGADKNTKADDIINAIKEK